jgi:hypothetical protein
MGKDKVLGKDRVVREKHDAGKGEGSTGKDKALKKISTPRSTMLESALHRRRTLN